MKKYNTCKICNSDVELINETHDLVKCTSCKLVFCQTIFLQDEFIKVYDELYNKQDATYGRHSLVEFNKLLKGDSVKIGINRSKLIKKNVLTPKCKSVLEIGSGVGLVGVYIKSKSSKIDYLGIELDNEAYKKSQILNLNTIHGDFNIIANLNQTFDVIMLWEVIEHLQDLKHFLELAYDKLNDKGKVILSAPNYNKIYNYSNREIDRLYQNEPPIHLNFFTTESIINVFKIFHFSKFNVNVKRMPYFEPTNFNYYKSLIKVMLNIYYGPTIYFEATKV